MKMIPEKVNYSEDKTVFWLLLALIVLSASAAFAIVYVLNLLVGGLFE